jgi:hypothetical protein
MSDTEGNMSDTEGNMSDTEGNMSDTVGNMSDTEGLKNVNDMTCCAVYLDKVYIESKIFPHNTIFSSWVVIKFWSVTDFPHASLHDLDESVSFTL